MAASVPVPPQPMAPFPDSPVASRRTGLVWSERYMWHDTGSWAGSVPSGIAATRGTFNQPGVHYENAETKRRLYNLLAACGLLEQLTPVKPRIASVEEVARFHDREYIASLKAMSDVAGGDAGECAVFGPGSFEIALLAVGGGLAAVDAVVAGQLDNAYVLCRPPGHHAERGRGRGFCLFNNVALAAMHAQQVHGLRRVAIVDYDVHHGNGTQQAFYEDSSVLVVSVHQDGLYPNHSGALTENGAGTGEGFHINVPLPPGTGVGGYAAAFDRVVIPALEAFNPELLLVSSGFDASALDPLSHMMATSSCFGAMATKLLDAARRGAAAGRAVFFHEGGYSEVHAPFCGLRVIEAMAGVARSNVVDEYDEEFHHYGYQALQPHQDAVIAEAERLVATLSDVCVSRGNS
eukprot:jgi/Tetstr1/436626/TSEL_025422.t1